RMMAILDAIPDGIYIVSQQYEIEYVNPVILQEFGSIDGRKCYEYFHDRTEVCPWCKNTEVFAGKSVKWEWYSFKNNRHYDLFDTPFINADNSISKFEIFHDVSDRKRAEEAVYESEEKYKGVVETLPALICTFSPSNGEILFVNNAYCEYFNKSRNDLIGTTFLDLIPEQDRDNTWNSISGLNKDNPSITHEHPVTTSEGIRWQKWTNQALFADTGDVIGYQSFGEDITERKQAVNDLKKIKKIT
ncbi:MAG: PAS domain S-box protein, partial [candidate division Zixibacteria bacterium]|nr:PAS domain S-box protein [candidate division Zixibacteria bacterium]